MNAALNMRFKDSRVWVESLGRDLLVTCPRCGNCASLKFDGLGTSVERRCVCVQCGYSDKRTVRGLPAYSYTKDWPNRFNLWLQTDCCGHVLWALNEEHFDFLNGYVSAKLRERRPDEEFGWSNHSLAGRLPQWLTSAKHRDEVARCLERLRLTIPR